MTTTRRRALGLCLAALACAPTAQAAGPAEKLRLLIIDGQNNHNWKAMTPPMKAALEASGRFNVEVATSPPAKSPASAWDAFRPEFARYDAVLSNYNGEPWPEPVKQALEAYVKGGGGLVVVHAANNAFPEWPAWNDMIGLGWRDNTFGDRLTVDDSGQVVRTPKGQGPGAGHGPRHPFTVKVQVPDHPITKGMPAEWPHVIDELYQGQRGPAKDMTILATAYAAPEKQGSGTNEPMLWVIPYGKGRVVTTVMGHVAGDDVAAVRCVGFQTVVERSCEWAATGKVTLTIPPTFPNAGRDIGRTPEVRKR